MYSCRFQVSNLFFCDLQFDHDPRQPSYIATQGPLAHTVADFWQVSLAFFFSFFFFLDLFVFKLSQVLNENYTGYRCGFMYSKIKASWWYDNC